MTKKNLGKIEKGLAALALGTGLIVSGGCAAIIADSPLGAIEEGKELSRQKARGENPRARSLGGAIIADSPLGAYEEGKELARERARGSYSGGSVSHSQNNSYQHHYHHLHSL